LYEAMFSKPYFPKCVQAILSSHMTVWVSVLVCNQTR